MEIEYDWGTLQNEKFINYIERIEKQIDECINNNQKIPLQKIMEIFNDVIIADARNNNKLVDVYFILKQALKKEPTLGDLNNLSKYIEDRLYNKINRKQIEPFNIKQLNIYGNN